MEGLALLVGAAVVAAVGVGLGILVAPAIDRLARRAEYDPDDVADDVSGADRDDDSADEGEGDDGR